MEFKLIPVYKPNAIMKNWKFLSEGMEKILAYAEDDTNLIKIFNELLSGELLMWIGFIGGEYKGFITTKVVDTPNIPMGNRSLWIMQLYVKPDMPPEVWAEGFKIIEEYAREYQCKNIKFWTLRDKGWERKLEPFGFKRGYQEFIKTLEKEAK